MGPLVNELKSRGKSFEVTVCVTGQHKEMIDPILESFGIVPDIRLDIMREGQSLSGITTSILESLTPILEELNPDIALVHGDTTTSFASALACFYQRIPVGHVEAGLRTYNLDSPWPEEFNRQVVDAISRWHFAPTREAKENLLKEGKDASIVFVTGNTGIDALQTTISEEYAHPLLQWASDSRLILITAHRRENIGLPMRNMFRAIKRVLEEHPDVKAIYPIHMNPTVRKIAHEELDGFNRLKLTEPLNVLDFHNIMARSFLILTDSGGIQEEAPSLGKPVLIMRDTTERPEGIAAGTLKLVGTNEEDIYIAFKELLESPDCYEAMAQATNPYGDGKASIRIADILESEASTS